MSAELRDFFDDLDQTSLRIVRPSHVIFLCGGRTANEGPPQSLRDYLLRTKKISNKFEIVLAEKANALYRETKYPDLISFEEDIAQIAALIVVIAESAGSLAELGAFASSPFAQPALRIMLQQEHFSQESFVRWGPVERIRKARRDRVGVYPWKLHSTGGVVASSVKPHSALMVEFLNREINKVPETSPFHGLGSAQAFFVIYWVVYLSLAIERSALVSLVCQLLPDLEPDDVTNKLFCMSLVGWIGQESYDQADYVYVRIDRDPFDYSFRASAKSKDSLRRKTLVRSSLAKSATTPPHVTRVALTQRARG